MPEPDRACSLPGLLLAAAALIAASCSREPEITPPRGGVPQIRVLLSESAEKVTVAAPGAFEVVTLGGPGGTGKVAEGDELGATDVFALGPDVVVGNIIRTGAAVELIPHDAPVRVGGRRYRGRLRVSVHGGKLRVVNLLDLESYLRGVVRAEMYPDWPPAALRAQAIAARTYALAYITQRADRAFDVYGSTRSQAYGGIDREDERTDAAVAATEGQVLKYRGRVFIAYFHSACGGQTASAKQIFADPAPPLQGSPCGYCDQAPTSRWTLRISRKKLAAKLRCPGLTGLKLEGIGIDGRVAQVTLMRRSKPGPVMAGAVFRRTVGEWRTVTRKPEGLLSTRFTVTRDGDHFVFEGRGHGHGVGMCQWGAKGMADASRNAEQILANYYPGAKIVKEY